MPGNHEYYRHDITITDQLKASTPANIHLLDRDDYEIFGTRVVCNPRGYPGEFSGRGFLPGLVVGI